MPRPMHMAERDEIVAMLTRIKRTKPANLNTHLQVLKVADYERIAEHFSRSPRTISLIARQAGLAPRRK